MGGGQNRRLPIITVEEAVKPDDWSRVVGRNRDIIVTTRFYWCDLARLQRKVPSRLAQNGWSYYARSIKNKRLITGLRRVEADIQSGIVRVR